MPIAFLSFSTKCESCGYISIIASSLNRKSEQMYIDLRIMAGDVNSYPLSSTRNFIRKSICIVICDYFGQIFVCYLMILLSDMIRKTGQIFVI